ncbi:ATP-dependent helicase [bacterium]|nr:MAG: ATP-dependent helicase [bacterium]
MNPNQYLDNFQTQLSKLTGSQKEAVETINGPVLVLAGPGSGKTTVLTLRIANMLLHDIEPERILCLTFTKNGATNMKEKLKKLIGNDASKVTITTFHGFCSSLIARYDELFPELKNFEMIDELGLTQSRILSEILKSKYYQRFNDSEFGVGPGKILGMISDFKRELITQKSLEDEIIFLSKEYDSAKVTYEAKEKVGNKLVINKETLLNLNRNLSTLVEFADIYGKYNTKLKELKLIDFDDVIIEILNKLNEPESELRQALQENFEYLLIDEYQDTNKVQNEIAFKLAKSWLDNQDGNIFVVGDDDQSIYRFQGANVDNIKDFLDQFAEAKVIILNENFRSIQEIIDTSRALIENNTHSLDKLDNKFQKNFVATNSNSGVTQKINVKFYNFSSSHAEEDFILSKLVEELDQAKPDFSKYAVIYRKTKHSQNLIELLRRRNIPYKIQSDENLIKNAEINNFLKLVRFSVNILQADKQDLFELLNLNYLNFDQVKVFNLFTKLSDKKYREVSLIDALNDITSESQNSLFDKDNLDSQVLNLIENFLKLHKEIENKDAIEFLIDILNFKFTNQTYFEFLSNSKDFNNLTSDAIYKLNLVNSFIDLCKKIKSNFGKVTEDSDNEDEAKSNIFKTDNLLSILTEMQDRNLYFKAEEIDLNENSVKLLTAHGSKGLEFETVFLLHCDESSWNKSLKDLKIRLGKTGDNLNTMEEEEIANLEEKRRLFYVAMTRAKKNLILISSKLDENDKARNEISFITEIENKLKVKENYNAFERIDDIEIKKIEGNLAAINLTRNIVTKDDLGLKSENTFSKEEYLLWLNSRKKNLTLSATSYNNYLECEYKFFLENIVKIPQHERFNIGNVFHKTMELWFQSYINNNANPGYDKLVEIFNDELENSEVNKLELEKYKSYWQKILQIYYDSYAKSFEKPKFVELWLSKFELNGISLVGKTDALFEDENNLALVDFKTGNKHHSRSKDGILKTNLESRIDQIESDTTRSYMKLKNQMYFYKLLVDADKRFESELKTFIFDFIEPKDMNELIPSCDRIEFEFSREEVANFTNFLKSIIAEILTKVEFGKTSNRSVCQKCQFYEHCWKNIN